MSTPDSSTTRFTDEIENMGRELSARTILFHEAVAARVGLSTTEHKCLDLLVRAEQPLTAGQLAELSGLTTGAITGIVDRLETAGFVARARSAEDRRKVILHPLPLIYAKYGSVMEGLAQRAHALIAQYSAAERAVIADYIAQTIEILKEEAARLRQP